MGDPETQVVIPRIKNDLVDVFVKCLDNRLEEIQIDTYDGFATTVILASNGYPNNYSKGDKIFSLEEIKDTKIFHAGTKAENGNILSNGGRVFACTGFGMNLDSALKNSYKIANSIEWKNKYFRKDIGRDLK